MKALTHTQVSVVLSLNVIQTDSTGKHFAVIPLLSLSWLLMAIWQLNQTIARVTFSLKNAYSSLWCVSRQMGQQFIMAGKLLGIGVNSLAWGLS